MARGDGRHQRWSTCERKSRFEEHTANRRASELGLRAYECGICMGWHLSHLPSRPSRYQAMPVQPRVSDVTVLGKKLIEASQILDKLLERQKAGVELPKTMIPKARARVEEARLALVAARVKKDSP